MKLHIGTKLIKSKKMNRIAYNEYRGWELPLDENPSDEGFLVEYLDGGPSNHYDHEGYISWSPQEVFEKSYQDVTEGVSFGAAIVLLKQGKMVSRKGWNGKGMYLLLFNGQKDIASKLGFGEALGEFSFTDVIAMKTADNKMVLGWLASQSDMLADDWILVD